MTRRSPHGCKPTHFLSGFYLRNDKLRSFSVMALAVIGMLFLAACGGGGGGGGGGSTSSGGGDSDVAASLSSYVMPGELSAVPSKESDRTVSLKSALRAFAKAAYDDADTDYSNAPTRKFVEEHSLEQFEILEDVLTAINQTKYYDEIGNPPYRAMVAMVGEGEEGGKGQKTLEAWVVEADIVDADGNVVEPEDAVEGETYNVRVRAWIEEEDQLIKAEFVITEEPTQNADGSYADYGEWTLNVKFGDGVDEFFAASCEVGANGESIIRLHEVFGEEGPGSGGMDAEIKAVMYRSEASGYGKVSHPDWEAIWGPESDGNFDTLPMKNVVYAYNDDYLALDDGTTETVKDRNDMVDMTHMYGVFNAATGNDIMRSKQFGFPIKFTDDQGYTRRGYYGAWQGRHQLWMEFGDSQGAADLEGTVVTKEDHHADSETEAQTYTVGKTFNGTLVKRTYVDASLNDIKNIPVEIWVNQDYQLLYNGGTWWHCRDIEWGTYPPSCNSVPVDFGAEIGFDSLVVGANDTRKQVHIGGWDETNHLDKQFVYLPANTIDSNSAGFYEAEQDQQTWQLVAKQPLIAINTANVTQLWVWIGGSLYVEYQGESEGWVEKEVVNFDERTWMPEFGDNDKPYILPSGRELYINLQGASYVVRKDLQGNVTAKLELQTAVNPENASTLVPEGTVFQDPWNEFNSTYELETDPASDNYLMLVYKTIGDNDKEQDGSDAANPGDLLTQGMWGIEAVIGGETVGFNWEYSGDGGWGSVTYLMDGDEYVLLDDPVRFDPITVVHNGSDKTLALQYDGWMMGLPDMYYELSKNDYVMNEDIEEKIINLPAGTPVTESATGTEYVLKPLEISQFLMNADVDTTTAGLDTLLVDADSVDLDTVPDFVEHNMGDMPSGTTVKYSEGILVE